MIVCGRSLVHVRSSLIISNTIFDTRSSSGGGQGQVGVAKSSELGTQLVGLSETKGEDISEDAEEMEEEKGRGSGLELFLQTVEVAPR